MNVYYIHSPDRQIPLEETLAGINELHKAGKFKHFGLSNFRPEEVQEVVRIAKEKGYVLPSVYQGNYNAVARRIEAELLPVLRENNIRFYAYSPIAGGFLTKTKEQLLAGGEGRWDPNSAIGQIYHRLYNKPAMLEVLDDWAEIAKAEGVTKAELAYRWIFFHSHIREDLGDAVIVGATWTTSMRDDGRRWNTCFALSRLYWLFALTIRSTSFPLMKNLCVEDCRVA